MLFLFVIPLLTVLLIPTAASAEVQTFTATHTYVLGDHDSKDDARQRCLLEAKRKVLEQAGVYIESASEAKGLTLTKDKITSFAAAVMRIKDSNENFGIENGHMALTLAIKADVDLAEVRKQLAARQVDSGVRDKVEAQQERLKRLEAQLEAIQQQWQGGQVPAQTPAPQQDDALAEDLQWLRTRAAQGHATAQYFLGLLYANGDGGVPQDYAQARYWYEKATTQGYARAQYTLGLLYDMGLGVPQDYVTARQWFEKAAAQGDADAQSSLGVLYALGQGVPKDYGKARQWWEKSAAQGNASAQFNLGELYNTLGTGVPLDYVKARQWFEKAAAQGNASAQINIGVMYKYGEGAPQDFVRAYMWFNLAAQSMGGAQQVAAVHRDMVASLLTPAQIAEAQRLAQQCQARQFKNC